jgi:hypothetical protein
MTGKGAEIMFALISLTLEKGIPFVQSAIAAWGTTDEEITLEKIEALRITKEPTEY